MIWSFKLCPKIEIGTIDFQQRIDSNQQQREQIAAYERINVKLYESIKAMGIYCDVPLLSHENGVSVCVAHRNFWLLEHMLNFYVVDGQTTTALLKDAATKFDEAFSDDKLLFKRYRHLKDKL